MISSAEVAGHVTTLFSRRPRMRLSSLSLAVVSLAVGSVAVAVTLAQTPAAVPGARGGRGGGAPAVLLPPGTPGYPRGELPDPSMGRKDKWPKQDAVNTPPEGYTPRSPQNNGFYRRDAQGNMLPGTDLYIWAPTGHFTNYDQDDVP